MADLAEHRADSPSTFRRALTGAVCLLLGLVIGIAAALLFMTRTTDERQGEVHDFLETVGLMSMADLFTWRSKTSKQDPPWVERKTLRLDIKKARHELAQERVITSQLRAQAARLERDVAAQTADLARMRVDLQERDKKIAGLSSRLEESASRAKRVGTSINARARNMAARNVAGAAAEAIPLIGATVVATLLAADVIDLCATLKDAHELNTNLDPVSGGSYCGYEVRSAQELQSDIARGAKQTYANAAEKLGKLGVELGQYRLMSWNEVKDLVCGSVSLPLCPGQ